jgi:hypothetical protein
VSRGPAHFRQRDLRAAIRAVLQAGREVATIEVDKNGVIKIVLRGDDERPPEPAAGCNPWDEILK